MTKENDLLRLPSVAAYVCLRALKLRHPLAATLSFRARNSRAIPLLAALAIGAFSGCASSTKPAIGASVATQPSPLPASPRPIAASQESKASNVIAPAVAPTPPLSVAASPIPRRATIKGAQEESIFLDNFTAFVFAVDGKKNAAGRYGWDTPLTIEAGHREIEVEFNRGVFVAHTSLELEANANTHYELRYATDAELFGHNSYCNFWIIDLATGKTVTTVSKASVEKRAVAPDR